MDILDLVNQGKYNEFADNVKTQLKQALSQHDSIKEYSQKIQVIHDQKNAFKAITNRD